MIYRCPGGHVSFAKGPLVRCGMSGCENEQLIAISDADVEWFYCINPSGLAMNERNLHMILKDGSMPQEVKDAICEIFPAAREEKKKRSLFGLR